MDSPDREPDFLTNKWRYFCHPEWTRDDDISTDKNDDLYGDEDNIMQERLMEIDGELYRLKPSNMLPKKLNKDIQLKFKDYIVTKILLEVT
jgi:hypothetical protein